MEHCNVVVTLAEPSLQLSKSEDEQDVHPTQYRRLIGSLLYLCNMRLELAFSAIIMCRFMERLKVYHLKAVKRILRYVKGLIGYEVLFPTADTGRKCNLLSFINSNWCGDKYGRKSTTRYIFMFGETLILWCLKKKLVISLSSCEAEYIATSLYTFQVVWLMNILKELGSNEGKAVTLQVDNF